ncbi:SCO1/SenC family protein [Candidatus Glomeribacter gigasporarum BEG34]|uniref:SCO1/SenC family protein n=1 Tax=Candidatus Glomeribacter gigasporarum BEG34 TaxID=1070319 RepID=G2J8K0_9BURK|nr:SCO family protein [Candidatus Glomeribacter gigasporarum]CCD29097.1 SCO1/SenC family protein [Candidatus Glomeribacter gigasporarum BEG34]
MAAALLALFLGCQRNEPWQLTNVRGHLPDLKFSLTSDQGHPVTEQAFQHKVALVYFGYTHCPDVCPGTLARLMSALQKLGNDARDVRILFISVDPARDTPKAMRAYVQAFDVRHIIGLTGSPRQIEALARRYRVSYQRAPGYSDQSYEVMHSPTVYIFDQNQRARLIAKPADSAGQIAHDIRALIHNSD